MADIKGNILVDNGAGGKDPFYGKTTADQVMFSDGETLEEKFRRLIVDHALLSDRAGTADRSDLSEDTRKFMGHPIEDFLLRDELYAAIIKANDNNDWKNSVGSVTELYTTYPDATVGNVVAVNGGDTAGSLYRFNGTDWEILVRNGKSVLPNNVVDKINQSVIIQKLEFGTNKWIKQGEDNYELSLDIPNVEIVQVVIYDGINKKFSTITPEYNANKVILHSVFPERGYILYYTQQNDVLNYGDSV